MILTVSDAIKYKGVVAWFAQNSVAANVLMVALFVGGLLTLGSTNSEIFPQIDPRTITVTVTYTGATPDEIVDSVTQRIDVAVLGLEGVDRVSSTATEGSGVVTVELTDFADAQTVKDDIQSAIDKQSEFPTDDADTPEISVTTSVSSVMRLVVAGEVSDRALRQAAEDLEDALIGKEGVSVITMQGVRDYEISIEIPQAVLEQFNLDIGDVADAIEAASVNVSGGTIRSPSGDVLLRANTEARGAADYAQIVVLSDFQGRRILLGEIATIVDGFTDDGLINTYNKKPAIFLQIDRAGDEDAFAVASAVRDLLDTYTPASGIDVIVTSDETESILDRINLLSRNGLLGFALVFVFLSLVLDLRLAFWATVGIPTAFLGGFIFFTSFTTINMITLFGLIMVLGIVVDDAIVVGESIYETQNQGGDNKAGAIIGAQSVLVPVLVGIATTIMVFAPLLWSSGTLGQILRPVPLVVIGVLLVSLVEVFLILPAHLAHGKPWSVGPMLVLRQYVENILFGLRDWLLMPVVKVAMRAPWVTVFAFIAMFIAFTGLFSGGHVRFIFFPVVEGDEVDVNLEMPAGTSFEQTELTMNRIVAAGYQAIGGEDSDVYQSMSVTIGGTLSSGFGVSGTTLNSEQATATLELVPAAERDIVAAEIERHWRENVGVIAGIKSLTFASARLSGGDDISYDLTHTNAETLLTIVERLEKEIAAIEGVSEVELSAEDGKRQFEYRLNEVGIAAGLTESDLAQAVRQTYFGQQVDLLQRGTDEVEVYVRYPEDERRSLADLIQLQIKLPNGEEATLPTIATITESRSEASIERVDGRRIISITADVDEAVTTPNDANSVITTDLLPALMRDYPALSFSQEGQARNQRDDLSTLMSNLMIAVLAIYCLLASILRSYIQPIIILSVIPFGLVGAVLGHMVLGYDLSFFSLFGVVALSGVIINDSIVLIDYFNKLQEKTRDTAGNIAKAVQRRFRPILLTTLTTFIGLAPMISETSSQAQFLIPMALSIAFGSLFAGAVILILVPVCLLVTVREPAA